MIKSNLNINSQAIQSYHSVVEINSDQIGKDPIIQLKNYPAGVVIKSMYIYVLEKFSRLNPAVSITTDLALTTNDYLDTIDSFTDDNIVKTIPTNPPEPNFDTPIVRAVADVHYSGIIMLFSEGNVSANGTNKIYTLPLFRSEEKTFFTLRVQNVDPNEKGKAFFVAEVLDLTRRSGVDS